MFHYARTYFLLKLIPQPLFSKKHRKIPITYADIYGRRCTQCFKYKPWSAYHKNNKGFNNHSAACADCENRNRKIKRKLAQSSKDKKKGYEAMRMSLKNEKGVLVDNKLGG